MKPNAKNGMKTLSHQDNGSNGFQGNYTALSFSTSPYEYIHTFRDSSGSQTRAEWDLSDIIDTWTHIAVTYDGSNTGSGFTR